MSLLTLLVLLMGCAAPPHRANGFVLDDAERFAALVDRAEPPTAPMLQADYLDRGTAGLALFTPGRIRDAASLARAIAANPAAYRKAVALCLPAARQMQSDVSALMHRVAEFLGQDRDVPAWVVFGAGTSGGTADARGLVLGLEVICREPRDRVEAEQRLRDFIAHETTHVVQARAGVLDGDADLLRQALVEGFADFVMEQVLGTRSAAGAARTAYGLPHEAALWRAFAADVQAGRRDTDWFFRQTPRADGRPPDMGYWIGKRICEAYVRQAQDRRAAIAELLALRDPQALLARSGYRGGDASLNGSTR